MRTKNLLKLAFTMLAMIVMTGAMAQQIPSQYTADETQELVQTEGISFRLYVQPDPLYNPDYRADATPTAWLLSTSARWTFTIPTGLSPEGTTEETVNWVEITNPVAPASPETTPYSVKAVESNTSLAASCVGSGTTQNNIYIIPAPTAVISDLGDLTGSGWTGSAFNYSRCAEATDAINVPAFNIAFTENTKKVANAYDYILTVTKTGYDINDTEVVPPADVTTDFGKADMQAIADYDASPIAHTTTNTLTILDDGSGNLVRTKYVFTLANISSKTSYLSYFRANTGFTPDIATNYYAVADQTVTLWLNPAPVTGPIYHIPNNYAF
ncbi:hypothetical protein [Perlabentimonas gracilis]|uniref:hypothetical protein n=1 Tax=Perlabentimonas gracilis TaxID=2715279 RepID=UPI00140A8A84|nr:hypothetical protein [Perlabentimonas gracilis]NHB69007.1 hypothetical protein [Perlabentimonas gracilis]